MALSGLSYVALDVAFEAVLDLRDRSSDEYGITEPIRQIAPPWRNAYKRKIKIKTSGYEERVMYVTQRGLYDQARSIEPRLRHRTSDHVLGHFLAEQGCTAAKVFSRRGWLFPDLSEARTRWEARFPGWKWRNPDLKTWVYEDSTDT
jgi:hypothetical protein